MKKDRLAPSSFLWMSFCSCNALFCIEVTHPLSCDTLITSGIHATKLNANVLAKPNWRFQVNSCSMAMVWVSTAKGFPLYPKCFLCDWVFQLIGILFFILFFANLKVNLFVRSFKVTIKCSVSNSESARASHMPLVHSCSTCLQFWDTI